MHKVADATGAAAVAVAASGGPDSTALLHCVARQARGLGLQVLALHVHHGLMPEADAWAQHLQRQVQRWARKGLPVALHVHQVLDKPAAGDSVEAWARRQRYAALACMARAQDCSVVMLAHHRRDQAETFLLQALRGGGAAALSGMPGTALRDGITWCRPWLSQPRDAIDAYLRRHRLGAVQDPSNLQPRYARSRLRQQVWPALTTAFPDAERALTVAAQRAQPEAQALQEWIAGDLAKVGPGPELEVAAWLQLSPPRRHLVLRAWLARQVAADAPGSLVERLCEELPQQKAATWPCGPGRVLRLHRQRLRVMPSADTKPRRAPAKRSTPMPASHDSGDACHSTDGMAVSADGVIDLSRPGIYAVPGWPGRLLVVGGQALGLQAQSLKHANLRARQGGERFQFGPQAAQRPLRSLKKQFQALGVPADQREGPLLYLDGVLAFVPGLGLDVRALRLHGAPPGVGLGLVWQPAEPPTLNQPADKP